MVQAKECNETSMQEVLPSPRIRCMIFCKIAVTKTRMRLYRFYSAAPWLFSLLL